jgi:hypothetical protein
MVLIIFFCYAFWGSSSSSKNDLTLSERKLIEKYVEKLSVEDAIGQI